jgi:hypothetical protein
MFDYTELTPDGKSSVRAYSDNGTTVVLHIWDADSFTDGVHEARIDIPIDQFLGLAHKIRMDTVS